MPRAAPRAAPRPPHRICAHFSPAWRAPRARHRHVLSALASEGIGAVTMSGTAKARKALADFNEDANCRVMLLHTGSAAAGLTLTVAEHVVLLEQMTDPAAALQAIGRVHRIGQTRETHVWMVEAEGTAEADLHRWCKRRINATRAEHAAAAAADGGGDDAFADLMDPDDDTLPSRDELRRMLHVRQSMARAYGSRRGPSPADRSAGPTVCVAEAGGSTLVLAAGAPEAHRARHRLLDQPCHGAASRRRRAA